MIKLTFCLFTFFSVFSFSRYEAVANTQSQNVKTEEKYKIIKTDQIDGTDVYAIPFDDSEIEDEEELNRLEKKKVFPIPNP